MNEHNIHSVLHCTTFRRFLTDCRCLSSMVKDIGNLGGSELLCCGHKMESTRILVGKRISDAQFRLLWVGNRCSGLLIRKSCCQAIVQADCSALHIWGVIKKHQHKLYSPRHLTVINQQYDHWPGPKRVKALTEQKPTFYRFVKRRASVPNWTISKSFKIQIVAVGPGETMNMQKTAHLEAERPDRGACLNRSHHVLN